MLTVRWYLRHRSGHVLAMCPFMLQIVHTVCLNLKHFQQYVVE